MSPFKLESLSWTIKLHHIFRRSLYTGKAHGSHCLEYSPNAKTSKSLIDKYLCLPIPECHVLLEYVFIDGSGVNVRSKSRVIKYIPDNPLELAIVEYNPLYTEQETKADRSEYYLCPVAIYNDPFRRGKNKLVMCSTFTSDKKPTSTNRRFDCIQLLNKVCEHHPTFGFHQEYQLLDADGRPFGWPPLQAIPCPSNAHYCGVGASNVHGRMITEAHYRACLYAGIDIMGKQADCTLSQWKYTLGPTRGIKAGDDLWMSRYILCRIAEEFGLDICFNAIPRYNWRGSKASAFFATKTMLGNNGLIAIQIAIDKMSKTHMETVKAYQGTNKVAPSKFTSGVGGRHYSVRIPISVSDAKKGFLEDMRLPGNFDAYTVLSNLVKICIMNK